MPPHPFEESQPSPLSTTHGRKRLVTLALNFTKGTPLAPDFCERIPLDRFVCGELTLSQGFDCLEQREKSGAFPADSVPSDQAATQAPFWL